MSVYKKQTIDTRWINFENKNGQIGLGGTENNEAKGHAFERLLVNETKVLIDFSGTGMIHKIWMTISNREPEVLNSVLLRCYWDNSNKPAVVVPLGDFFCANLGITTSFENEFFSNPEGRSFNCYVPMPFRTHAKITLTNNSKEELSLFYDINLTLQEISDDVLYFHAFYNRKKTNILGENYTILPKINGEGRLLGVSFGILTNPHYKNTWWGEGEVKIYLDDDHTYPTLVGTGLEDYIGTAWGQGIFANRYQGSLVNNEALGQYVFYRFHEKDPVYFNKNIKVVCQEIGGAPYRVIKQFEQENIEIIKISVDKGVSFTKLFEEKTDIADDNWVNFFRSDDYSSVAYFYLDSPSNDL